MNLTLYYLGLSPSLCCEKPELGHSHIYMLNIHICIFTADKDSSVSVVTWLQEFGVQFLPWARDFCWLRHYATGCKVACSILDEVTGFFNSPNPSSHTVALWSTQPLTEMSTWNLPVVFTAISEPIVWKMWEPQHFRTP
jgi:hypothetical protein